MSAPVKLFGFVAGLALIFLAALATGTAFGPVDATDDGATTHDGDPSPAADAVAEYPGGLMTSQNGYTLALAETTASPGQAQPLGFGISTADGQPLTGYQRSHDKDLHLIAVRRDLTGFQHVHPEHDGNGRWSTELDLTPGTWRVFADFDPAGDHGPLTLGVDLHVAGDYRPEPMQQPSETATVDDYEISLAGGLTVGQPTMLELGIHQGGRPVTDLQPYLAAYGHLVVLRAGDLAYLHVHPDGTPGDGHTAAGPEVAFHATAPSPGSYRMFLDFLHEGVVRTAEFTVDVPAPGRPAEQQPTKEQTPDHGADHPH